MAFGCADAGAAGMMKPVAENTYQAVQRVDQTLVVRKRNVR